MQDDLEVLKAELAEAKKTAEDMKKKVEDAKAETERKCRRSSFSISRSPRSSCC